MLPQNDCDDGIHSWLISQRVSLADVVGWPPVSTWLEAEYDPLITVDQYPRLVGNRKELRTLTWGRTSNETRSRDARFSTRHRGNYF
jgi:hypothetical protein